MSRAILNYVELGEGFSAQEMAVPGQWVGKSLRELELPRRYNIAVIAVHDVLSGADHSDPEPGRTAQGLGLAAHRRRRRAPGAGGVVAVVASYAGRASQPTGRSPGASSSSTSTAPLPSPPRSA